MTESDHPIILFDGVCNLCDRTVRWIIRRDRRGQFRFASLQSAAAARILHDAGAVPSTLPDSVVLVEGRRVRVESDAVLAIAGRLGFPWSIARVAVVLPRWIRNPMYRFVARRRVAWFGKKDACSIPAPSVRERFLDADEAISRP